MDTKKTQFKIIAIRKFCVCNNTSLPHIGRFESKHSIYMTYCSSWIRTKLLIGCGITDVIYANLFFKMAECSLVLSHQHLRTCVDSLLPLFKITSLKKNQFEALYWFVSGREVYVSLPTGSGKSVIFHLIPLVHTWIFHNNPNSTRLKKDAVICYHLSALDINAGPSQHTDRLWT